MKVVCVFISVLFTINIAQGHDRITGKPFATRSRIMSQYGMAATSQPLATQAALDILKQGGNAVDADDLQWGIVRRGTTEAFAPSDEFNHDESGDFKTNVSSILADKQGNVWVAYASRPSSSWGPKSTTLRKMACVR